MQAPDEQILPPLQATAHAPQLLELVLVFTQAAPQTVWVQTHDPL